MSIDVLAMNFFQFSGSCSLHSTVRLGSAAGFEVIERVEHAVAVFSVTMWRPSSPMPPTASVIHIGSPPNSSLYSGVRRWRAMRRCSTKVVHDLLRLGLGQDAGLEVALKVDVEEGRGAAEAHRRAVLLLDAGEVAEVQPLHGFPGVFLPGG